ncbi:paxillin-like [Periplaneta americana]|uniref:paxillin-like n=1 Tax=Periplaneta americana TaxID=6978 RepID=UPI0037E9C754
MAGLCEGSNEPAGSLKAITLFSFLYKTTQSEIQDQIRDVVVSCQGESEVYCYGCQQPIKGRIISALEKTWHPDHFVCAGCNKPITSGRFYQKDGKPYCEEDYSNLYLKKCVSCNQPIKDTVIVALNRNWHAEHFVCIVCGMKLGGTTFFERDEQPYCQNDYYNMFAPKCADCNKPITETAVMALCGKWHQTCFKCQKCNRPIVETTFEVIDNKPVCASCS